MSSSPVTLDMSTAQPIPAAPPAPITLDMSTAQPISSQDAVTARHARAANPSANYGDTSNSGGVLENVAEGVAKGTGETVTGAERLAGVHPTGVYGDLDTSADNLSQGAGKLIESGAEFMTGDSLIGRAAKFIDAAGAVPAYGNLVKLAKDHKWLANILEEGIKGGVIGGAQGAVKGEATGQAKEGAIHGAEGGAAGGAIAGELGNTAEYEPRTLENGKVVGDFHGANVAQGSINRSMAALPKDVYYGDPSKALMDENITNLTTAGRINKVADSITSVESKLRPILDAGPRIDVASTVKPIVDNAELNVMNSLMTPAEKTNAFEQLNVLRQRADQLGVVSSTDANQFKRLVGDSVNWKKGTEPLHPDVESAYRKAYGTIKNEINTNNPGIQELNERLTNLYAARTALTGETGHGGLFAAEVAGKGPMAGLNLTQRAEAAVGHVAPKVIKGSQKLASSSVLPAAGAQAGRIMFKASDGSLHSFPDNENAKAHVLSVDPAGQFFHP